MATTSTQGRSACRAAGQAIFRLNNKGIGYNDPRQAVKTCVDWAVRDVFMGHATVQLQGGTAKGTEVQNRSDWNFLVCLDTTIPFATQAQRTQVHYLLQQYLAAAGIYYSIRTAEKRLHLRFGSVRLLGGVKLPDAVVVLERFKLHAPDAIPKSNMLALSFEGRWAASHIKSMAAIDIFKNTLAPRIIDDLVATVDYNLRCQQGHKKEHLQGSAGFNKLLINTLQAVAGIGSIASDRAVQSAVQNAVQYAGLGTVHWRDTAKRELNQRVTAQRVAGNQLFGLVSK